MKILKQKIMKPSDSDKFTIRLLRQEYFLNEQQHTLKMIDDEEYERVLDNLNKKISVLEAKYGMVQN